MRHRTRTGSSSWPAWLSAGIVVTLLCAGCATVPPSEVPAVEPTTETVGPGGAATPAASEEAPVPALVTCGAGEPPFPPQALDGPGTAQTGDDAASAALRRQIAESSTIEEARLPPTGWHRVAESASEVLFVAPGDADTPWLQVAFRQDPTRGLVRETVGRCDLRPLPPPGATLADWWLDPAAPAPRPGDVAIAALIEEVACAGGDTPAGRVLAPTIRYERDRIVITVAIRTLPGNQSCIGNAPFPVVIDLVEPIGDRLLLDGSVFPPRDARLLQD